MHNLPRCGDHRCGDLPGSGDGVTIQSVLLVREASLISGGHRELRGLESQCLY